jgi:hypothetical protein
LSFCTRNRCDHDRGVFAWLGDGPWLGDEGDPDYGGYPFVHDTTMTPGHLEVCELMAFATAEEAGVICACGHLSDEHESGEYPIPYPLTANPRPCPCGCPDFKHRPEDLERYWANERGRRGEPALAAVVVAEPELADVGQLELFASPARTARRQKPRRTAVVPVAGGVL